MTREQLRAALDSATVVDAQPPARYDIFASPGLAPAATRFLDADAL